jgi:adenine deaminase
VPEPVESVAAATTELDAAAASLGCEVPAPFAVLSFLALPSIPELRLTDRGLVDVAAGSLLNVWLDEPSGEAGSRG